MHTCVFVESRIHLNATLALHHTKALQPQVHVVDTMELLTFILIITLPWEKIWGPAPPISLRASFSPSLYFFYFSFTKVIIIPSMICSLFPLMLQIPALLPFPVTIAMWAACPHFSIIIQKQWLHRIELKQSRYLLNTTVIRLPHFLCVIRGYPLIS